MTHDTDEMHDNLIEEEKKAMEWVDRNTKAGIFNERYGAYLRDNPDIAMREYWETLRGI